MTSVKAVWLRLASLENHYKGRKIKKAMVLLGAIALIFLPLNAVTAQIQVDKPALPDGYASWPDKNNNSCQGFKETTWVKIAKEKNTLEIVSMAEMNGKLLYYDYTTRRLQ